MADPASIGAVAGVVAVTLAAFKLIEAFGPRMLNGRFKPPPPTHPPLPGSGELCRNHGERLATVEADIRAVRDGTERVEKKLDRALERK